MVCVCFVLCYFAEQGLSDDGLVSEEESGIMNKALDLPVSSGPFRSAITGFCHKLRAVSPTFIFISAGFDGHRDDPISAKEKLGDLEAADFRVATAMVMDVGKDLGCPIQSCVEGGYIDNLGDGANLRNSYLAHAKAVTDAVSSDDYILKLPTTGTDNAPPASAAGGIDGIHSETAPLALAADGLRVVGGGHSVSPRGSAQAVCVDEKTTSQGAADSAVPAVGAASEDTKTT